MLSLAFWGCTKKIKNTAIKTETLEIKPAPSIEPKTDVSNKTVYEVLSIRRSACFGKCPAYEAKVMSDGTATFKGGNNVEKIGNYSCNVDKKEVTLLVEKAKKINYFTFQNRYPADRKNEIADLPFTFTSVNDGKTEKKIANNYDCPAELIDFEREIDTFFEKLNWKESKN